MTALLPPVIPDDLVALGRVSGAYGVRGHVKVHAWAKNADTLTSAAFWWLQALGAATPHALRVLACKRHQDVWIVQFEGVTDRDQAQSLKGATLQLPRACFPEAADDEYYWVDLIGCQLYGQDAQATQVLLGQVVEVSDNGAHAVLHVKGDTPGHTRLIPFVAAHIVHVALDARRINTNWPADF